MEIIIKGIEWLFKKYRWLKGFFIIVILITGIYFPNTYKKTTDWVLSKAMVIINNNAHKKAEIISGATNNMIKNLFPKK